ncbi:MAG: hypothetical protein ACE5JL_19185 [Dehalococcoidia bacterium]
MERRAWPLVAALIELPKYYKSDETGRRELVKQSEFIDILGEIMQNPVVENATFWYNPPRRRWRSRGIIFRPDVILLEVHIFDSVEIKEWLLDYVWGPLLDRFSPIRVRLVQDFEFVRPNPEVGRWGNMR